MDFSRNKLFFWLFDKFILRSYFSTKGKLSKFSVLHFFFGCIERFQRIIRLGVTTAFQKYFFGLIFVYKSFCLTYRSAKIM